MELVLLEGLASDFDAGCSGRAPSCIFFFSPGFEQVCLTQSCATSYRTATCAGGKIFLLREARGVNSFYHLDARSYLAYRSRGRAEVRQR